MNFLRAIIHAITFKHFRDQLRNDFERYLSTVRANTLATSDNTISIEALRSEQRELRAKLDTLVEHSTFQVRVKRQELTRAGHNHH